MRQIASIAAISDLIQNWDISQTEGLLEKLRADKEKRRELDRQRREAEMDKYDLLLINSLPNDEILDQSKFKAFADDKINVNKK